MDFDNSAQVDALAKLPAEPVKPAPKWSAWSAPLRAVPAAAAEAMAGAGEVATAVGRSVIANRDAPRWKGQTQTERETADRQAQAGVTGQNEFSRTLRDVAEHYAPDPATASTAENVVYQLTRGLGKALGYGLTMGPVGIGLFAADEGLTEADRLQRQGVDAATATQAGVVTGLATGAGALVPVAPLAKGFTAPNVAKVTGLAAVSGPMTFAAQQQMTRDILAGANYAEIAKRYDPLDPLGLTLSAVAPWAFGAVSLRGGAKAGKPAPSKPAEAGQIEPPVAERPPADTQAPTVPPEAVDAAMVHNLTLMRSAQEATPPAQGMAEAMRPHVTETPSFRAWFGDSKVVNEQGAPLVVYHGTGRPGFDSFDPATRGNMTGALDAKSGFFFSDSPKVADEFTWHSGNKEGAIYPVYLSMRNPLVVSDFLLDGTSGTKAGRIIQDARAAGHDGVIFERSDFLGSKGRTFVALEPTQAKSAIGNSGRFDSDSPSLTDPVPPKPAPEPRRSDAVERARTALLDLKDSGDTPDVFLAKSADLPPETRNLFVGLVEAGADTKRADAMLADFERTTAARPDASPVDISADVVEAARAGNFVTPEPAAAPKPTDPLARSIADRVQAIEQNMPELKVDDGTTAAEYMAKARREAMEGTADELGMADTDLVRVAAECALMVGAT